MATERACLGPTAEEVDSRVAAVVAGAAARPFIAHWPCASVDQLNLRFIPFMTRFSCHWRSAW